MGLGKKKEKVLVISTSSISIGLIGGVGKLEVQ